MKQNRLDELRTLLAGATFTPQEANLLGCRINHDGRRRSAWDLLAYPDISYKDLASAVPGLDDVLDADKEQLEIEALYAGFVERQRKDVDAMRRDEDLMLPKDIDYSTIGGLSTEIRTKLTEVRPQTIGQASRIEGVTPGALTAVLAHARKRNRIMMVQQ